MPGRRERDDWAERFEEKLDRLGDLTERLMTGLEARLDRIDERMDWLDARMDQTGETLIRQEATLSEHIRRTEIAEERLELLRKEFRPIKDHVAAVGVLGKIVLGAGALAAAVLGIRQLFERVS